MDTSQKSYGHILAKRQRNDNYGIPPLSHNGSMYTDPSEKAETLNSLFSSIFINSTSTPPPLGESSISDITHGQSMLTCMELRVYWII